MTDGGRRAVNGLHVLSAVAPAGPLTTAAPRREWYCVGQSRELGERPLARTLLGVPLVLFREKDGTARALLDRCPHRNVPLSLGSTVRGQLRCAYHGWEFDGSGRCKHVPALDGEAPLPATVVPWFATREADGLLWVWASADAAPTRTPHSLPHWSDARYTTVRDGFVVEGTLHAYVENTLDVPHTAFLHGGWFRRADRPRQRVLARVRREARSVEAELIGERAPAGLVGRLLAPNGGALSHVDRFLLPAIAEVEYRMGDDAHFTLTSLCAPISELQTRVTVVASYRLARVPGFVVRPALELVARQIFRQDQAILSEQAAAARRFGGEAFSSTPIDLLGADIRALLLQAERAERENLDGAHAVEPATAPDEPALREVPLWI